MQGGAITWVPDESIKIWWSLKDLEAVGVLILVEFVKIVVAVFELWAYTPRFWGFERV